MKTIKKLFAAIMAIYNTYFKRAKIYFMVQKFRAANGSVTPIVPTAPPEDRVRLCAKLLMEEAFETVSALYGAPEVFHVQWMNVQELLEKMPVDVDLIKTVDGLTDVDYVNEYIRQEIGVDGLPFLEEVQRANMAKFGPGSWVREDGKRMKPPGWEPPDIRTLLIKQGWTPPPDAPKESGG